MSRSWLMRWFAAPAVMLAAAALCGTSAANASGGWMVQPVPSLPHGKQAPPLPSVSCYRPTACFAVSQESTSYSGTLLAFQWNGSGWALQRMPKPANAQSGQLIRLGGVSCPSAANCLAVGSYTPSSGSDGGLAERWTGARWRVVPVPVPGASFAAVSCPAVDSCTAVGEDNSFGLAASWNGSRWTREHTPAKGIGVELDGVSCVSATSCVASGYYYKNAETEEALAESWNGSSWSVLPSPQPASATQGGSLGAISCSAAQACTATGVYETSSAAFPLIARWNGTSWSAQQFPAGGQSGDDGLGAVSCPAQTSCTATDVTASGDAGIIAWNGTSWTTQATPAVQGKFLGLSCPDTAFCMAVGYNEIGPAPLSEDN